MRFLKFTFFFLISFLLLNINIFACEPVLPLVKLIMPTPVLSVLAFRSIIGLLVVIIVKWIVFSYLSKIDFVSSFMYVLISNAYSTIPGIILSFLAAVPIFFIFPGGVVIYFVYNYGLEQLSKYYEFVRKNKLLLAFLFTVVGLGSLIALTMNFYDLNGLMNRYHYDVQLYKSHLTNYWIKKYIFIFLFLTVHILITIAYEAGIILNMSIGPDKYSSRLGNFDKKTIMEGVIWANLSAFFVIFLIGAILVLPERMKSPDFLIGLIHSIFNYLMNLL